MRARPRADAPDTVEHTIGAPRRNRPVRTLRRIRIEDTAEAERMFDLLMGSEVPPRREFIIAGASEIDESRIDT